MNPYEIDFRKGRWALATQASYTFSWRVFVEWCEAQGLPALPAAPETIAGYIQARSELQRVTGMQTYLNGVRAAHRLVRYSYDDPECDEARRYTVDPKNPIVLDAMKEVKRAKGTRSEPKKALTWEELCPVIEATPLDGLGLRDRAMMMTGFGAALRRGEVVALNRNDLTFSPAGVSILIRRSKTDQAGRGTILPIPRNQNGLCPVQTIYDWLQQNDQAAPDVPAFTTRTGRRCTGWDYALIIKRAVERAGVDPAPFSGHSMRRGYITTAFRKGATVENVMEKSRHSSPEMAIHYREASQVFDSAADKAVWG